jgi:hypothetical protein
MKIKILTLLPSLILSVVSLFSFNSLAQRKTLVKHNGVSVSYEVEKVGVCDELYAGVTKPVHNKGVFNVYKYDMYLTNDNANAVEFTSLVTSSLPLGGAFINNCTTSYRDTKPNAMLTKRTNMILEPGSEVSAEMVLITKSSSAVKPGCSNLNFKILASKK